MSREGDRVAVVGGGLSGLATALALQRLQRYPRIDVFESGSQQDFDNNYAGAAVQLTPNGLRALGQAAGQDVLNQVLKQSSEISKTVLILPPSQQGDQQLYDNLQTMEESAPSPVDGLPTVMIRWSLLRKLLAERLAAGSIIFHQHVSGHERDNTKIRLQIRNNDNNTISLSEHAYSLVIAADGKHSCFRPTPLQQQPRINLKAVVHKRPLALPNTDSTAYSLFLENGICLFCGPASSLMQDTYWAISLPNNDCNVTTKSRLLQHLRPHAQTQVFTDLIEATDESHVYVQYSSVADLPQQLALDSGSVCLVGDAAHAMSASYGQATSLALEDAATLASCLSLETHRQEEALLHYSRLRRHRCVEMQTKSQERYQNRNTDSVNKQDSLTRWIHDWTLRAKQQPQDGSKDTHMVVVG